MTLTKLILFFSLTSASAYAGNPVLKELEAQAQKEDSAFKSFSAERGEKLFRAERLHSKGEKVSCTTCHTSDPKNMGRTRANKDIEPLATVANPKRFTDMAKVEKWFRRNCQDVLERQCTTLEKGDFVKYMTSLK